MTLAYDILFRVQVEHPYYQSGFSDDFEFLPTPSCQLLLDELGWRFRAIEYGFMVLARITPQGVGIAPDLFSTINQKSLRMAFEMRLRNPYFQNINTVNRLFIFNLCPN